ncbi:MAG: glycyl-radical enzyme activating protein [Anaerolineaceae bacterium]|nr:glycyl-radical enzyme activating protein [Anaerolineaceae bacterium]
MSNAYSAMNGQKALILNLQRLSTEDGPGLRTTIFFKGCPLRCEWCHNPESIDPKPQIHWLSNRCIGDRACISACPRQALGIGQIGQTEINRSVCTGCGTCAEACPGGAIEKLGKETSLEELLIELRKDRAYFTQEGGVTASGGEPMLQSAFVAELFKQLKAEGFHTALDTSGAYSLQRLEQILPHTDLVLYDLKLIDPQESLTFTGMRNELILENLKALTARIRQGAAVKLWIRTPLIPSATATEANLNGIARWLEENAADVVERWEICAFNNLCADKYSRLGMEWRYKSQPLFNQEALEHFQDLARAHYLNPDRVSVTGSAKK